MLFLSFRSTLLRIWGATTLPSVPRHGAFTSRARCVAPRQYPGAGPRPEDAAPGGQRAERQGARQLRVQARGQRRIAGQGRGHRTTRRAADQRHERLKGVLGVVSRLHGRQQCLATSIDRGSWRHIAACRPFAHGLEQGTATGGSGAGKPLGESRLPAADGQERGDRPARASAARGHRRRQDSRRRLPDQLVRGVSPGTRRCRRRRRRPSAAGDALGRQDSDGGSAGPREALRVTRAQPNARGLRGRHRASSRAALLRQRGGAD